MLGRWTFTPSNRGAACSQCVGFTSFGEGDLLFVVEPRNFPFKMVEIIRPHLCYVAPEIRAVANLQCLLTFLELDGISFNFHKSRTSALMASWHRKAPSTFVICLKLWPFAAVLRLQALQGTLLTGCAVGWPADDQGRVWKTFLFFLYALGFCWLTQTMLSAELYLSI